MYTSHLYTKVMSKYWAATTKVSKTIELLAELYGATSVSIVEQKSTALEILVTSDGGKNSLDGANSLFPLTVKTYCRCVLETDAMLYVKQSGKMIFLRLWLKSLHIWDFRLKDQIKSCMVLFALKVTKVQIILMYLYAHWNNFVILLQRI